jgi:hypothetical protein
VSSGFGTFTICVDEEKNPLHYPYGHGHLILQRGDSDEFCSALTGLVPEIIRFALSGGNGNVPSISQWQKFADDRVDNFLSHIRLLICQRIETLEQDGSFTELYIKPLIFLGADRTDVMQSFYRLLWENTLEGRNIRTGDLSELHQEVVPALSSSLKPMEQLYELANFGCTYSSFIRESLTKSDLAGAKQNAARLQETEELVHLLGRSAPLIWPLAQYHAKRQRLHIETDSLELSTQMIRDFSDMQGRVLVLLDLTKTLFHTTLQNEAPIAAPKEGPING